MDIKQKNNNLILKALKSKAAQLDFDIPERVEVIEDHPIINHTDRLPPKVAVTKFLYDGTRQHNIVPDLLDDELMIEFVQCNSSDWTRYFLVIKGLYKPGVGAVSRGNTITEFPVDNRNSVDSEAASKYMYTLEEALAHIHCKLPQLTLSVYYSEDMEITTFNSERYELWLEVIYYDTKS